MVLNHVKLLEVDFNNMLDLIQMLGNNYISFVNNLQEMKMINLNPS